MAVAENVIDPPVAKLAPAVGLVWLTTGAVLPPPHHGEGHRGVVVLNAGLPLSVAVAVAVCVPFARPVALKL